LYSCVVMVCSTNLYACYQIQIDTDYHRMLSFTSIKMIDEAVYK